MSMTEISEKTEKLKELVKAVDNGETMYGAKAKYRSYQGSLMNGGTDIIIMTKESSPETELSPAENEALGLLEEIEPLYVRRIGTCHRPGDPEVCKGFAAVVNDAPFAVWSRYRARAAGERRRRDEISGSYEVKSREQLVELFKGEEAQ